MAGEYPDPGTTVDRHGEIEIIVDLDDKSEPVTSIVTTIADAMHRSVLDLPPVTETVDPDALNRLFSGAATADSEQLRVTFSYAGCTVDVFGTGRVCVVST